MNCMILLVYYKKKYTRFAYKRYQVYTIYTLENRLLLLKEINIEGDHNMQCTDVIYWYRR